MPDSIEQLVVADDGFTFPAEEILTGRGFVTGKSGSGKSNTASVVVEELLDRNLPLLIVDTDGEYAGLRESYDLVRAGAGDDCDVEVTADDAAKLTGYALEDQLSVLLDVSTYQGEDEIEAVIHEVVEALFVAEHDYRIPFLLVVEEAHEFIPQQGGSELKSLLIRVAKRGRKRGLGICCLSQRPASVDKDYITQCDWFVWHRLTWENDTDVVARILGSDAAETVRTLDDGEALVQTDWDEATERVQFRRRSVDDAGSTPSLEDLRRSRGNASGGRTASSGETTTTESSASGSDGTGSAPADSTTGGTEGRPGAGTETELSYDEGSEPDSTTDVGVKPSLERRRDRHDPPSNGADPLWEVGAMMVYLYDSLRWYNRYAVASLEARLAAAVARLDDVLVGRRYPPRPGERIGYRLLAILVLLAGYAVVVAGLLVLAGVA